MVSGNDRDALWNRLVDEIIKCKKCDLYKFRLNAVPGEGSLYSDIMFIGEAPGGREDELGRPFVGAAGNLLTRLLEGIGLRREDVFIANVLKCRPPGNRDPAENEVEMCLPYLIRQIELIRPRIIVTLGRYSAAVISRLAGINFRGITQERGKPRVIRLFSLEIVFLPMYHPAAALYRPPLLKDLKRDFETLKLMLVDQGRPKDTLDRYL